MCQVQCWRFTYIIPFNPENLLISYCPHFIDGETKAPDRLSLLVRKINFRLSLWFG